MVISALERLPKRGLSDDDIRTTRPARSELPLLTRSEIQPQYEPIGTAPTHAETAWGPVRDWVRARIEPLRWLPLNWDSYGGHAVVPSVVDLAEPLVTALLLQRIPPPAFVPTSEGGLSLEWKVPSLEIVMYLPPTSSPWGDATAFVSDDESGEEWESTVIGAPARVAEALLRLAQSGVAP